MDELTPPPTTANSSAVSPLSQQRTVTPLGRVEVILSCVQRTRSVKGVGDALSFGRPVSNIGCDIRCHCIYLTLLSVLLRGEKKKSAPSDTDSQSWQRVLKAQLDI